VAILTDISAEKDITKEIENPKNWENLNKKYYGKLNDNNNSLCISKKAKCLKMQMFSK
jgi:hypothetical protein